ncbi:MAG: GNAT family N-acetyltransferase [Candidatus Pelagibacter sp. TMED286]|nr:MAG: GNAT family N-acetyltransferase [Candidatus Pelagibacter sp. TMED286]
MNKQVERNYLEINSVNDLIDKNNVSDRYSIEFLKKPDFQINKFFYKNVGKKHNWVDRLIWTEKQWIEYVSDKKVKTYILKDNNEFAGYFELIFHKDENEVEIAYLGLLEEYLNLKLGSYILSTAIKKSFILNPKRVWVHTCSLDHKNALNNYISRGMKIFKKEIITI